MDLIARRIAPLSACRYVAIIGVVMSLLVALALANRVRKILGARSSRSLPAMR